MNKKNILVLAILILLSTLILAVFFWGDDQQVETREFSPIANLSRVEIMPPPSTEGPELIVLERRSDDQWWMTRPREQPIWWRLGDELDHLFRRPIGTDDLHIDASRADAYGLGDDEAVRIALFEAGADRPTREFLVGRQIEITQTGATRTFVQVPGGEAIYRAQRGFGELVRLSVDQWFGPDDAVDIDRHPAEQVVNDEDEPSEDPPEQTDDPDPVDEVDQLDDL